MSLLVVSVQALLVTFGSYPKGGIFTTKLDLKSAAADN
jgi:hypothetical protein